MEASWKGLYKVGGAALLATGILYLVGTSCGYILGTPPGNSDTYLQSLATHPTLAYITYAIFGMADLLFIPSVLALYLALKGLNNNAMLVAAGIVVLFIILDLGITELNSLTLVTLTQNSANATSDAQRLAYYGAEHFGLATLPVATFLSWAGPCIGFIIMSVVMLKGIFRRFTARLGIIANILGIVGGFYFILPLSALGVVLTPILYLYGLWLVLTGLRLFKVGRETV